MNSANTTSNNRAWRKADAGNINGASALAMEGVSSNGRHRARVAASASKISSELNGGVSAKARVYQHQHQRIESTTLSGRHRRGAMATRHRASWRMPAAGDTDHGMAKDIGRGGVTLCSRARRAKALRYGAAQR